MIMDLCRDLNKLVCRLRHIWSRQRYANSLKADMGVYYNTGSEYGVSHGIHGPSSKWSNRQRYESDGDQLENVRRFSISRVIDRGSIRRVGSILVQKTNGKSHE